MHDVNLLPADTFIVYNKTILNNLDRNLLVMLYQPIIGSEAVNLYFTLWAFLDKNEVMSCEWTHHHLMLNMSLKMDLIKQAREKLEAIGLLKTYLKQGDINNYVYEMYSPMSAYDFINNSILGTLLLNTIGDTEYYKLLNYFKIPKVKLDAYEEISVKFNDIFEISSLSPLEVVIDDIKRKNIATMNLTYNLDINEVLSTIPEEILNIKGTTKEIKELILKLAFVYNLNEENVIDIIRNSINEKRLIDKKLLRENAKSFYQFENSGKLPNLVYRKQPLNLRTNIEENSNKAKIIYTFENTSPYDFLSSKYKGVKPTKTELGILEYLAVDLNLNPGVINVLIDYVLKINNNKLNRAFVETIASQWKRSDIKTVRDAMKIAASEYKKKTLVKSKTTKQNTTIKPEWFDKNIKTGEATIEEKNEIDNLLSEF